MTHESVLACQTFIMFIMVIYKANYRFVSLFALSVVVITITIEAGCPPYKFGADCSGDCHCRYGVLCDPVTGLCADGLCNRAWTGPSCQIEQPVMRLPPDTQVQLRPCGVIVTWLPWNTDRDIGTGSIHSYLLQYKIGGGEWYDDDVFKHGKNLYKYLHQISSDHANQQHVFRLIIYMDSSGKPKLSIPGPASPYVVPTCPISDTATTTITSKVPSKPGRRYPVTTPEMTKSAVVTSPTTKTRSKEPPVTTSVPTPSQEPIDHETGPKALPLPVTLAFDDENQVVLTPIQSYDKTYQPERTRLELSGDSGEIGFLPPGTEYSFELFSSVSEDPMVPVKGTFWTPPLKPPEPPTPGVSSVTNETIKIVLYPLNEEAISGKTPLESYEVIVEDVQCDAAITFEMVREELEFTAEVEDEWLILVGDPGRREKRDLHVVGREPWTFNDTTNFYVTAVLPGNETCNETFIIGDDKLYGLFRNRALQPGTEYVIWVAASSTLGRATRRSFTKVPFPVRTMNNTEWLLLSMPKTEENSHWMLTVILVCVLVIIPLVLVVLFILLRKKYRKKYIFYTGRREPRSRIYASFSTNISKYFTKKSTMSSNTGRLYRSCDPIDTLKEVPTVKAQQQDVLENFFVIKQTNTLPVRELYKYLQEDMDYSMADEFRSLPNKFVDAVNVACMPQNSLKNRSMEVIPYDKNRVKMVKNSPGDSPYINASQVKSIDKSMYVVTQVPMSTTIGDFWRMVWEQEVGCIVMLMSLKESGKPDCEQYWPNKKEPLVLGELQIQLINQEYTAHYKIRDLRITQQSSGYEREITQFQFISWNRGGLPSHAIPYVDFVRRVQEERDRNLLTLVHCHAGGGRSGVFIAVDSLLNQGKQTGKVDVQKCVTMLRLERPNLVKTYKQYRLVYECLAEAFDHPECRINGERFEYAFDNQLVVLSPQKMSALSNEYESLRKRRLHLQNKKLALSASCTTADTTMFQSPKKRGINIQPDATLQLPMLVDLETDHEEDLLSDAYCKPIILDVFRRKKSIAVSQHPNLPCQVDVFWKFIISNNVRCVVDINSEFGSSPLPEYFPAENEPILDGTYCVTLMSQTANPFESSSMKEVTLNHVNPISKTSTALWTIRLFQWHGWPSDKNIPSISGLLNLVKAVRNWNDKMTQRTATFILGCHVSRAALFALVWTMSERLEDEWLVDIYTSTKYMHHFIPRAVTSLEQYRFLYRTMKEHVQRSRDQGDVSSVDQPATSRRASSRASRGRAQRASSGSTRGADGVDGRGGDSSPDSDRPVTGAHTSTPAGKGDRGKQEPAVVSPDRRAVSPVQAV